MGCSVSILLSVVFFVVVLYTWRCYSGLGHDRDGWCMREKSRDHNVRWNEKNIEPYEPDGTDTDSDISD